MAEQWHLDPKTAFGRIIKAVRMEQGVSQEALADLCRMSRPQLSSVETGQTDLKLTSIFRLAQGLDVHATDLMRRTEEIMTSGGRRQG